MKKGLVLGFFDGVHIAHQNVINFALKNAEDITVVTFQETPLKYFGEKYSYVLPREISLTKIKNLGVSNIVELNFSKIANLTAEEYLDFIINKFHPDTITTGFNHTFGKNRTGNPEFLASHASQYNYEYFCVPDQKIDKDTISSTLIRELLQKGDIQKANTLLGSKFQLNGKVIEGNKIGRTIGFPTANINYPKEIIQIPYGVYSAQIGEKKGILNWGIKPTIEGNNEPVVEIHIIDFNKDIYGKTIKIELLNKIRDEKKFKNLKELKEQIKKDTEECLKL